MIKLRCIGLLALSLSAIAFGQVPQATQGISKPSLDAVMTFGRPGRVAKIVVKEGDTVKAGQLLVQLDDREERAQVAIDESKAKDTTAIKAQEAVRDQKQINYKKMLWAAERGGASPFEVDAARVDSVVEEARLAITIMTHEQDVLKYEQTRAVLEKCSLLAPFDGLVEEIFIKTGEGVDSNASTKVIRVVNIDPLWVEAWVPISLGRRVKTGQTAEILFSEDQQPTQAKVLFVGAVADAASETVMVRLTVPNPRHRLAGEQVSVQFPLQSAANDKALP